MTIPKYLLLIVTVTMVIMSCSRVNGSVAISGTVVLQKKWSDFQIIPRNSRLYKQMKNNIKTALQKHFEDDPEFWNVTVTQLREDRPSKQSAIQGYLAAEFTIHLQSKSVTGLGRLRDTVNMGRLGNMKVKNDSLRLEGIPVRTIPRDYNTWPSGNYGLPKPKSGCPGNEWSEGFRYQDSENFDNINNQSAHSHISGNVTRHGIRQEFCIHGNTETTVRRQWPMGKYCIYKYGDRCPRGLHEGYIYWDDENTPALDYPNEVGGEVPDGIYDRNTLIYYCCDNRGKTSTPILLPTNKPFFLFPFGTKNCQKVHQFKESLEYILFDDEDRANKDSHSIMSPYGPTEDLYNTRLYYCYYTPIACKDEHRGRPGCFRHFLPSSSDDGTNMMMNATSKHVNIQHSNRAFAMGSVMGLVLMGWAAFMVALQRIVTTQRRARRNSLVVHYY